MIRPHLVIALALASWCSWGCKRTSDLEYVHLVKGEAHITGTLKNGKRHGQWITVENGKITEIDNWLDGLEHGPYRVWFEEDMYMDQMQEHGQFHGRSRIFYSRDQIAELAWYFRNMRDGTWCSWNPDGSLEYIRVYYRDKLVEKDDDPPGECPLVLDQPRHLDWDDQDYSF